MEFIDTHQHSIWRNRMDYPWTKDVPCLRQGDFLPATYHAMAKPLGVAGTIFMESAVYDASYQDEARFVATQIGHHGILAQIASCRPEDPVHFAAWLEECSSLGVCGFRRILHVMPDDLSRDYLFRQNIKAIGRRGLPFDICVRSDQLPIAFELAKACDDQVLILDHCGVPDIASGAFTHWAACIRQLATLKHVYVKLSGLPSYCRPGEGSFASLTVWVRHVIESFGPARIIWGSDWPVVNINSNLAEWMSLTRMLIADLSADEQAAISGGTAKALYLSSLEQVMT